MATRTTGWRQIAAIAVKELQLLRHDPPALAVLFAMPAFFILVMSFALESVFEAGSAARPITVAVVDRDEGDLARAVLAALAEFPGVQTLRDQAGRPLDESRAKEMVRDQTVPLALVIPPGFTAGVLDGRAPAVSLIVDPATNTQMIAPLRGIIRAALERSALVARLPGKVREAIEERARAQGGAVDAELLGEVDRGVRDKLAALGAAAAVELSVEAPEGVSRRRPTATEQSVPAYAIFGVFFISLTLATSFVRERENGIDMRLSSAPVSQAVLLIGKVLPYYLVNLVQIALMFAAGVAVFSIQLGNLGALAAVSLAVAAAANGLGLLVAALARTEAQVGALAVSLSISLAALGGIMVPSFVMPDSMRAVAQWTPHYWALQGYHDAMLRGRGVTGVGAEVSILVAFAAAFFAVAAWRGLAK